MNSILKGGTSKGESEIANYATAYILEYQQGRIRMNGPTMKKPTDRKWEPPTSGWIKANFDGARNKDGKAGRRVILKDEKGKIWASYVNNLHMSKDSDHVESVGALRAVELAKG
ncbi:hypothetical protein U1Q18_017238 [Sarracenia purpurea var. burkii]